MCIRDRLRTVLYYGYDGPGGAEFMAREGGDAQSAFMDTWWAVRLACGETSSNPAVYNDPNIRWLLDHAPVEVGGITVSGSPDTRWNVGEKMQETDWYTTSGSGTCLLYTSLFSSVSKKLEKGGEG